MHGSRVDRSAWIEVRGPLSRRSALGAGALGVAAAMARRVGLSAPGFDGSNGRAPVVGASAAQSTPTTCPAESTTDILVDGAWLCRQPYALCTTAPCERSTSDETIANCRCVVLDDCGHVPFLEKPRATRRILRRFWDEVAAGA